MNIFNYNKKMNYSDKFKIGDKVFVNKNVPYKLSKVGTVVNLRAIYIEVAFANDLKHGTTWKMN